MPEPLSAEVSAATAAFIGAGMERRSTMRGKITAPSSEAERGDFR